MRSLTFIEKLSLAYKYITEINSVMSFPYKTRDEIRAFQLKKIQNLLIEAYNNVPFYKKLYDSHGVNVYNIKSLNDFSQMIPTITKKDIAEHGDEFINTRFKKKKLVLSRSSGTTGAFIDLYSDSSVYINVEIQVIRMIRELYDKYSFRDKEVLVYTSEYPISSIFGAFHAYYINNLESYNNIFNFILQKRPTVLAIYPSILREIIRRIIYDFKSLEIKLIITNSEASSQVERQYFAEIFNCTVIDEFSSEEIQSIAYQCKFQNYHEIPDCSYIELLESDSDKPVRIGERGEIVGTSLLNFAMPLIRYRQGDTAISSLETCQCGKNTPVLVKLEGRCNSSFHRINGDTIPSGKLLDWSYSLVLDKGYKIHEFQIIQETMKEIVIYLVADTISGEVIKSIETEFNDLFGEEFHVEVIIVEKIPKTKSGKHIPIISKVKKRKENKIMYDYVIVHASYGHPFEHWTPWLFTELTKKGKKVLAPQFPCGYSEQNYANWEKVMDAYRDYIDENTTFIGHSIGPAFICDYIANRNLKVKNLFLIAPTHGFIDIPDYDHVNSSFFELDNYVNVKFLSEHRICYISKNDPYVPNEISETFANTIDGEIIYFDNAGHFNTDAGYSTFEYLLSDLEKF